MCSKMLPAQPRQVAPSQEGNEGTAESVGADFWGEGFPRLSDLFSCSCTKRPAQDLSSPSCQSCPEVGKSCWGGVTAQLRQAGTALGWLITLTRSPLLHGLQSEFIAA